MSEAAENVREFLSTGATNVPQLKASSRNARLALEEFNLHVSRYQHEVTLNGRVTKAESDVLYGGCAAVWSGTLGPKGDKVAIKIPRIDPPGDETTVTRALEEVRQRCELKHENVLPLLGITTDFDLVVSVVSPWIGRGNAHDYVQETSVDPYPLIKGIAQGLEYLHTHESGPIFHGNLKGPNVLVSDDGQALISDFHIGSFGGPSFSTSNLGAFRGTANWMAPEITEGGELSAAADVWAFGMTALELFTRKIPFHQYRATPGVILRIFRGPPDRPTDEDTCSRMLDDWWDICTRCWNRDPSSRPTISEIIEDISVIVSSDPRDTDDESACEERSMGSYLSSPPSSSEEGPLSRPCQTQGEHYTGQALLTRAESPMLQPPCQVQEENGTAPPQDSKASPEGLDIVPQRKAGFLSRILRRRQRRPEGKMDLAFSATPNDLIVSSHQPERQLQEDHSIQGETESARSIDDAQDRPEGRGFMYKFCYCSW